MKRAAALFFLLLFLFNIGGYYLVFMGMQHQAKRELLHRLEADSYSAQETVILTLPLNLPYPIQETGFQRVDGEFEYQGEFYRLAKQKLERDTLYLVCVKDVKTAELESALKDYSKLANDIPAGTKHTQVFLSKLFKDFNATALSVEARQNVLLEEFYFSELQPFFQLVNCSADYPPPKA